MKIDIVIPIRNGQDHIIECLNSLNFQENIGKIIVINDGSTDTSEMIINNYIEKHTNVELHSTAPRGVSAARNFGVGFTSSKYIAFLDSDDYWMRGKLTTHHEHLSIHPKCVYSFSHALTLTNDSQELLTQGNNFGTKASLDNILLQNFIIWGSASSVVVSRAAFDLVGGFNVNLEIGEDWDLWVRLSEIDNPCEINHSLVVIRNRHNSSQRIERVGDRRFLASKTYCLVWERYPQIFKDHRFQHCATEILWGDIRRYIKITFLFNRGYDRLISSNFPLVYQNLKSKWHSYLAIALLIRKLKITFCSLLRREYLNEH